MTSRTIFAAGVLLTAHGVLLGLSIPRNSVTIDEVVHLPVGIAYWERGEFWGYHHNPPLMRLVCALPLLPMDVPTDYSDYQYEQHSRAPDSKLARDFMLRNRHRYIPLFSIARSMTAVLSLIGGWFIFVWSRELFGDLGGLLSLSLWVLCPNVLAHAGLVTPDIGSTVLGFISTFQFWEYLRAPSRIRALWCGVLLGLTVGSKFTFVVLPLLWLALAMIAVWRGLPRGLAARHAVLVFLVSLIVLNDIYLCEGTGRQLGSFAFRSRTLTKPDSLFTRPDGRENRFQDTLLESVPIPVPEHFVLGFDDQLYDVDTGKYYKYLRGDLRRGDGWRYYYIYCILVKTPVGTLILAAAAILSLVARRCRTDLLSEMAMLIPIVAFMASISMQVGLNSHLRYILPIYPFVFVWLGRLGTLANAWMTARSLLAVILIANTISVMRVHPHYLVYFNGPAGGPESAMQHLADSNVDWGQGLIALRDWLDEHAPDQRIKLAYFGTMFPEVLGIQYDLPPIGPRGVTQSSYLGPVPGLQAVSANYLLGIPFPAPDSMGDQTPIPLNGYTYYRYFHPIATPGWSIYVYDLSLQEVNRVRRELGLPLLSE